MAAPVRKSVEVFYDVVSPYAWIGFEVITRYRTVWKADIKLRPFFLGGVMQASGNQPPMMVAAKGRYMHDDLTRLRKHFQVPLNHISDPFETVVRKGSLAAMRFVTAIDMTHPDLTEELCRQLWLRIWSRDQDITEQDSLIAAAKAAGISDAVIQDGLARMKDADIKKRLKDNTTEAIEMGAFGAPTFVINDGQEKHLVWGSDRFHIIGDLLGEPYVGPLTHLAKAKL